MYMCAQICLSFYKHLNVEVTNVLNNHLPFFKHPNVAVTNELSVLATCNYLPTHRLQVHLQVALASHC
jgi:hypothetical protein